nr:MAG: L-fucokinase [Bacteriophage sp.]
MGLKKYEIITVGNDKRVRALRSWAVGDRYVNIGDVGGIVYDEKTLSQDGACWLFRGNFGFPGARIGGDSIVDVAEATLHATGAPNVDILGSSVVVGSKLQFEARQTAVDTVVLGEADFEQGLLKFVPGTNWETWKSVSNNYVRTKAPIFLGGVATTLKVDVPGYAVQAYVLDRDGNGMAATASTKTGAGVTIAIPAGQYFLVRLVKEPFAATVPADATTAKITFTGTYETKLSIIDSRVEVNPATSTGTATIRPGGTYTIASGAKYPDSVIRNSKVAINGHATANRTVHLMSEFTGCNVTLDATAGSLQGVGIHSNVKNLTFTGAVTTDWNVAARSIIQANDCNDFVVSPTVFPGLAAAQTANMPFIFQGCNVPNGIFYHHAQIANTYKNIDFAKAQADLGKATASGGVILVSSEVEGMYRAAHRDTGAFGALVESYDSVRSVTLSNIANSYGTTIYKDAYVSGKFDFAGTNVFGHKVRSHPLAQVLNVQPRAVQGTFNTVTGGQTITGVVTNVNRVCVPTPFRVTGGKGITILTPPAGLQVLVAITDFNGKVIANTGWVTAEMSLSTSAQLQSHFAYVMVGKVGDTAITPTDLAGVTVTTYNGCKIVNTGETAVNMKGNIRVEDNATLTNSSITGTGYFGGNAVMSGMAVNGYAYMKDNTLCTKTSENVQTFASLVMEGNAVYNSIASLALRGFKVFMYDESKMLGDLRSVSPVLLMKDNATIAAGGELSGACMGTITIKDNAIVGTSISTIGAITLAGNYKGNVVKTWTGKRTITDVNEPEYDNNVKTQYDF